MNRKSLLIHPSSFILHPSQGLTCSRPRARFASARPDTATAAGSRPWPCPPTASAPLRPAGIARTTLHWRVGLRPHGVGYDRWPLSLFPAE